jgi:hypothetical protein
VGCGGQQEVQVCETLTKQSPLRLGFGRIIAGV